MNAAEKLRALGKAPPREVEPEARHHGKGPPRKGVFPVCCGAHLAGGASARRVVAALEGADFRTFNDRLVCAACAPECFRSAIRVGDQPHRPMAAPCAGCRGVDEPPCAWCGELHEKEGVSR